MHKEIKNISIIISSNSTSLIYLQILKKNKFLPHKIIFLKNSKARSLNKKILIFLRNNKKIKSTKIFISKNINNKKIINYLKNQSEKTFVVSLYPGINGIIKNKEILKKKNFIHSHTGKLPFYKGSTTIYYSLLRGKKIWCDTFFLNKKIDQGKLIYSQSYSIPKNIYQIESEYDSKIRALNIVGTIKKIIKKNKLFLKKKKSNSLNYYIIHPILRLLTFEKYKNV